MKIVAFGASSSKHSINKQFAKFTTTQFGNAEILVHFSLPKFQENFDAKSGFTNDELKNSFIYSLNLVKSC